MRIIASTRASSIDVHAGKYCEPPSHSGPLRQVSIKQRDTEADLAKAEPAVEAAMAALDTLNKKVSHPE